MSEIAVKYTDHDADEAGNPPGPLPKDMYYACSTSSGEQRWDWLAKGEEAQGEAQLRLTPAGDKFYSCWLEELEVETD